MPTVQLPEHSVKLSEMTEFDQHSVAVLEYIAGRKLELPDTDYYWCNSPSYRSRLIIPFYYRGNIVGWTARSVTGQTPKYLTQSPPGFVYGLDAQTHEREFCIVCEGQIDAIHVSGCALGGSEISDTQALMLNTLHKQIIVVPDRDKPGLKLVERAIELGWSVSLPQWPDSINDISDAVEQYGRLYALYAIADAAEESPLKIRLAAKKWINK
jgi:DNA primase